MNATAGCNGDHEGPYITGFIAVLSSIIGLVANLMVIIGVAFNKTLRNTTNILMVNITCCNVFFCITVLPIIAHDSIYTLSKNNLLTCKIFAYVGSVLPAATLHTLVIIAVIRYIAIVHSSKYHYTKSKLAIIICLILCWLDTSLTLLPYYLKSNVYIGFCPVSKRCLIDHKGVSSNMTVITWGVGFSLPSLVVVFCYVCIFFKVRSSRLTYQNTWSSERSNTSLRSNTSKKKRTLTKETSNNSTSTTETKMKRREMRLAITTAIVFTSFFISYIPSTLFRIIDKYASKRLPHNDIYIFFTFYWIGLSIDPFIYIIMNREFKMAYKVIFHPVINLFAKMSLPCCVLPEITDLNPDLRSARSRHESDVKEMNLIKSSTIVKITEDQMPTDI